MPPCRIGHQAIATGRCHYLDHHKPPLVMGDARSAEWQWQIGSQGEQRLILTCDGIALPILPLTPPHYIDPEHDTCGVVKSGVEATTAARLLQMPAVAAEKQQAIFSRLATTLPPQVPSPVAVKIENRFVMPTPVLLLFSRTLTATQIGSTTGG